MNKSFDFTHYSQRLQCLIEDALKWNNEKSETAEQYHLLSGVQLYVEAPRLGFFWSGASGYIDHNNNERMTPDNPVRIASITKTFIAAAILRLWEENQLNLDGAISEYLSLEHINLIRRHHYCLDNITPRHLLSHTSGLFDYADSQIFHSRLSNMPRHQWTRTEQLELAMNCGEPYGKPGEVYRYSDTGYILLGEIIERLSDQALGPALRDLLNYEDLCLSSTWLEDVEPVPAGSFSRVHQYVGSYDFTCQDASCDIFGGGGLVSTVKDMAHFFRALFTGGVYLYPSTIKEMLTTVPARRGGPMAYGHAKQIPGTYLLGIDSSEGSGLYGHSGYLGTYAGYLPTHDLVLSFSMNQHFISARMRRLLVGILECFEISRG